MQSQPEAGNRAGATLEELSARYDEVPYLSGAFPPSRPDNLSVVGALAGLTPAPVANCRILEIGCAAGGNLLPMAQQLPESRFIGIDWSPRQIEQGRALIQRIGLGNIELRCQNLLEFADEEPFDYIIAHGFYSWVPQQVRDRLMLVCKKSLAPSGLAYFSYNTLPGWHIKRVSRDMMRFHSRGVENSVQRVARAREIMAMAAACPPPEQTPYGTVVQQLSAILSRFPDWFLEHDDLGLVNEPVYFEDFVRHAQSNHLRYIGGARPFMNVFQQLPDQLRSQLQTITNDPVALEQYADFFWGIQYRDSVFCGKEAVVSQSQGAAAVQTMYVAAQLLEQPFQSDKQQPNDARFWHPARKREIVTSEPSLIAVLRLLARSWPRAVSFKELFAAFKTGGRHLNPLSTPLSPSNLILSSYTADILELWSRPTDFIAVAPPRPLVTSLARLQAETGSPIINLRHEQCPLNDPLLQQIVPMMDGTRDRSALMAELESIFRRNGSIPAAQSINPQLDSRLNGIMDEILSTLSSHSLLLASS